jgi:hypothetical protein
MGLPQPSYLVASRSSARTLNQSLRGYQNPADSASCTLTVVEVQTNVKGLIAVKNSRVVNFTTRLADGKQLITRNMELKSLMDKR